MPTLIEYLVKLSISLAVVWLFYQFVLRRLTFYNHNRWYLLGYSLLSFVIPFIDVTPALHQNELTTSGVVEWVPLIYNKATASTSLSVWNVLSMLIVAGMLFMFIRLIVQLYSFRRMMKKATLISKDEIQLYQVNESIIPFSFGNAVFFNVNLHTTEELEKIIRHEFVHVKQRHSIDIIFSEILCLINWYNPFAWLIKAAIRQNLEFVADNKVIENGINKKQYQYLLLKVIGNNQFSIAQKFNFSSLKKRIAMMNKNKSAKKHLFRFLFLLPVLAVILVSFRKEIGDTLTGKQKGLQQMPVATRDTVPTVTEPNDKGYIINVIDKKGDCTIVIKDKQGKEVKRMLLTEWKANAEKFEDKYGEIPPPPHVVSDLVKEININNDHADVRLKNGELESYNLNNAKEKEAFEKKYGDIPAPPAPPAPPTAIYEVPVPPGSADFPVPPAPPAPPVPVKLPDNVKTFILNNNKATIGLKNGEKEYYDLNIPAQKILFEKKYGKIPEPPATPSPAQELKVSQSVKGVQIAPVVREIQLSPSVKGVQLSPAMKEIELAPVKSEGMATEVAPASAIRVSLKGQATTASGAVTTTDASYFKSKGISGDPVIVLNGEFITKLDMESINPEDIQSVSVFKGEKALAAYGAKAHDGAIVITTKSFSGLSTEGMLITADKIRTSDNNDNVTVTSSLIELNNTKGLVMLDGKALAPNSGKLRGTFNIVTLKKEEAIKKYGDKGKDGATEITTLK